MNHPAIPNPIIPGFAPDTQIYREGEDYYAAFSSFEYFPGLPIYHSRDLIHWEIFSHAWHRPEQFDLHDYGCSDALAGTTISKWKGKYVVFTTMTRRRPWSLLRMGYVTADSLSGPFSDPIWIDDLPWSIDPMLYQNPEDGSPWIWFNLDGGYAAPIDLATGRTTGPKIKLWGGTGRPYPESARYYFRDGWHYLLLTEGGTHQGHCASVARSRKFLGPYEPCPRNPVLGHTHLPDHPVQAVGHTMLFDDHRGLTWATSIGIRHLHRATPCWQLGREAFLLPVTWDAEGWPVFGDNGVIPHVVDVPPSLQSAHDDFDKPVLSGEWLVARHLDPDRTDLATRPGWLRLKGSWRGLENMDGPTALLRRQRHHRCRVTALMEFRPTDDNQEAGLCVFSDNLTWASFGVFGLHGQAILRLRFCANHETRLVAQIPINAANPLTLEVEALPERYIFSCTQGPDIPRITLGEVPTAPFIPYYTGSMFGLFCTGHSHECAQPADFDWFCYEVSPFKSC